ncbi:MAG: class I SAM-dependent methyltransferase, partial [Candidatus Delongbacteria bacterium]|nr:class I SAM-dependent methyltransferase [Candidatus Delongbacteria bacterium]
VAQQKTMRLAETYNVQLQYHLLDVNHFDFEDNMFDAVGMIFLHLPPMVRKNIHNELFRTLKLGGVLIMEAFDKSQLKYGTGGPKNPDMLYSPEVLKKDFVHFSRLNIRHTLRKINEGTHHVGEASVIQVKAVK